MISELPTFIPHRDSGLSWNTVRITPFTNKNAPYAYVHKGRQVAVPPCFHSRKTAFDAL